MKMQFERVAQTGVSMYSYDSEVKGPKLVITANIHGDEMTGLAVVHHLRQTLGPLLRRGIVYLYPSLNPEGLASSMRLFPMGGQDMNRLFPGNGNQSASRYCASIWNDICSRNPDVLIDLHTDAMDAIPYVIMDRVLSKNASLVSQMCELARAGGLSTLWEYDEHKYRKYELDNSLSGAFVNRMGKPALTIEVGPRRSINLQSVECMLGAVKRILEHLGMVKPLTEVRPSVQLDVGLWKRGNGPLVLNEGYWVPYMKAGQRFIKGDTIGVVLDSSATVIQRIEAVEGGFIIAFPDNGVLRSGQSCATIAIPEV